jgi:hypothetical protein
MSASSVISWNRFRAAPPQAGPRTVRRCTCDYVGGRLIAVVFLFVAAFVCEAVGLLIVLIEILDARRRLNPLTTIRRWKRNSWLTRTSRRRRRLMPWWLGPTLLFGGLLLGAAANVASI